MKKGKGQGLAGGPLKSPGGRTHNPKTDAVVDEAGLEAVAERGAADPRKAVPRAAANNSIIGISTFCPGTAVAGCTYIAVVPVVLAPFINIAMHVAEAKGIGYAKVIDWGGLFSIFTLGAIGVGVVAVVVGHLRR